MTTTNTYEQTLKEHYSKMSEIEQLKLYKKLELDNDNAWKEYKQISHMAENSYPYTDTQIVAQFDRSRKAYTLWCDINTMQRVLKEVLGI